MINQNRIKKVLRANSPEDIAKKINLELKESGVFASPIHQDNISNQYISFIYSREQIETQEVVSQKKETPPPHRMVS